MSIKFMKTLSYVLLMVAFALALGIMSQAMLHTDVIHNPMFAWLILAAFVVILVAAVLNFIAMELESKTPEWRKQAARIRTENFGQDMARLGYQVDVKLHPPKDVAHLYPTEEP